MRFLLTLAIWAVFIGGLYLYTSQRNAAAVAARESVKTPEVQQTMQRITVELTPTFSIEKDPFALTTDAPQQAIDIRLNGVSLSVAAGDIGRGKKLLISDVEVAAADHNELFIKASPPVGESGIDHGIRVRLLDGGRVLADRTIWSSGGGLVAGSVAFARQRAEEDGHDH